MDCPACGHKMKKYELSPCDLDQCEHCGGVWFEYGELKQLQEIDDNSLVEILHANSLESRDERTRLKCPVCDVEMKHYQYDYSSGIWIDRCDKCKGVYLDHKDLEKLDEYLDTYHKWDEKIAEILPELHATKFAVEKRFEEIKEQVDDLYLADDLHKKGSAGKMFRRFRDAIFVNKLFK